MRPLLRTACCALVIVWLGGCGEPGGGLDENNRLYRRGLELREDGQFEEAARAFDACLRRSPQSYLAHLQLGVLYDDHFQDWPRAITHYQAYLKACPPETDRAAAERARRSPLHGQNRRHAGRHCQGVLRAGGLMARSAPGEPR